MTMNIWFSPDSDLHLFSWFGWFFMLLCWNVGTPNLLLESRSWCSPFRMWIKTKFQQNVQSQCCKYRKKKAVISCWVLIPGHERTKSGVFMSVWATLKIWERAKILLTLSLKNVHPCEIPSCQISLTVWMPGYQPFLGKPKPLIWWGHRLRAGSDYINLARFCLDCAPFQPLRYAEHDNERCGWQTLLCGTTWHPGFFKTRPSEFFGQV